MNKIVRQESQRIYGLLLNCYPKKYKEEFGDEMQYVFSESLKDAYKNNGGQEVINLWARTIIDAVTSLLAQHLENQKGNGTMESKNNNLLMQNRIFLWIALGTGTLLLIPLIAMQFTTEVNWSLEDFILMGVLLFGMASFCVLVVRRLPRNRAFTVIAFIAVFLYIWAELGVGIFTNWGS